MQKEDEDLNDLIAAAREAKAVQVAAEEQASRAMTALMDYLARKGQRSGTYRDGSRVVVAKVVQSETTTIDEAGLRKAIGATMFGKVSVQRLDQSRLKGAIVSGEVDPMVVAQFTTIKQRAPYVRFTESEVE